MYELKNIACYLMASNAAIRFFYFSLFHRSTKAINYVKGTLFTTLIANIHYSKQSVVDSRKLEGYLFI